MPLFSRFPSKTCSQLLKAVALVFKQLSDTPLANEMGGNLTTASGPSLEKGGDLVGILTHLETGDVLFVD